MSDNPSGHKPKASSHKQGRRREEQRLSEGMDRMLSRVSDAYRKDGNDRVTTLSQALEHARARAEELGELTRDEARMLGEFLWRDLEDAGGFLARTGKSLRDWLNFDLELLERESLERFMSVADRTRLEWLEFQRRSAAPPTYRTGEMTTAGTLECLACGAQMRFKKPGHIPPCARCGGTEFQRPVEG